MKKIVIALILLSTKSLFGQQIGKYKSYYQNTYLVNPSYVGINEYTSASILHQNSLVQFTGSPKSTLLTIDGRLNDKNMGVGVKLVQDNISFIDKTEAKFSYSYKIDISEKSHTRFGASLGFIYQAIDFSQLKAQVSTEEIIANNVESRAVLDGDFGASYTYDKFTLAVAAQNILRSKTIYLDNTGKQNLAFQTLRSYHILGSYKDKINENWDYRGILSLEVTDGLPFATKLDAQIIYDKEYLFGVSYTSNTAFGFNVGMKPHQNIRFNYGYEITTNSPLNFSTHEIMLSYRLHKKNSSKESLPYDDHISNERVDYIEDKILEIEEDLEKQKKRIDSHEKEINELKNIAERDSEALQKLRNSSEVYITKNNKGDEKAKKYYVIISAFKDYQYAKKSQLILKKETRMENYLKKDKKGSFHLIYTKAFDNIIEAKEEYKKMSAIYNGKPYVYGNVWIYSE